MKPAKEQVEAYKAMAKNSPNSMKAMIEENLKLTCDKYEGHEDRLDNCITYLTECAREILNGKIGEVDNETCFRICRDYFNDEIWKAEDEEKAKKEESSKKKTEESAAKKAAADAKKRAAEEKKKALEAKKAEIARKKAEEEAKKQAALLVKKKAEEEKKAELERKQAEAANAPEQGQLDFFALMGV